MVPTVHARKLAIACILGASWSGLGCRTECVADEKATPEQVQREQKAVLRGQPTCKELVTPKLVVVDDSVMLTAVKENVLAKRADLPRTEAITFAPLHDRLKGYREHFKSVRMAEPFEPTIYVTLDPALEPVRAKTLLATAALAGFPRSRVYTNDLVLDLEWWLPRPGDTPQMSALCIEPRGASGFTLRFDKQKDPPRESASVDALSADLVKACEGRSPCAAVVAVLEREGGTFLDIARVLGATLPAPPFKTNQPRTVILTRARDAAAAPCRGGAP